MDRLDRWETIMVDLVVLMLLLLLLLLLRGASLVSLGGCACQC